MRKEIQSVLTAVILLGAANAMAQVEGGIITKEGRKVPGLIQWSVRDKAYKVSKDNVDVLIEPEKIDRLVIPKPNELLLAQDHINKCNAARAIQILQGIVAKVFMLTWDETATRLLADAYLAEGKGKEALDVCEKILKANPDAGIKGDMAPAYWKALLMTDRVSKLDEMLTRAVKEGDRTTSAFALISRGDLIRKSGDTNEQISKALCDGYLRVVTLYKGIKAAQPEALYKAAQCFEKLGQSSRADTMRSTLKSEYGSSEWARK